MAIIGALIIGGAAIAGSQIAKSAAESAAETQAGAAGEAGEAQIEAAQIAADAQRESLERSLEFQQSIFDVGQENLAPFLEAGQGAVSSLSQFLAPGGPFLQDLLLNPFQFEFGQEDFEADPSFQFRLQEGERALNRAAAARGSLVSGGQLRDLAQFNQDLAAQEFGVARDRALQEQLLEFESRRAGGLDVANLLSNLAGLGQVSGQTGAQLGGQLGISGGRTLADIGQTQAGAALGIGGAQADAILGAANARAAGQVAQANQINQALGAVGQIPLNALLLSSAFGGGGGGGGFSGSGINPTTGQLIIGNSGLLGGGV